MTDGRSGPMRLPAPEGQKDTDRLVTFRKIHVEKKNHGDIGRSAAAFTHSHTHQCIAKRESPSHRHVSSDPATEK
ncbi:hypothetical protein E2C01_097216 [Portunus trituberculatus]|uniref:Uncharacterized protein n=1 Tax=Portunus trituberculatus TaxID=210409 RepID=A0A5B7K8Z7_PORTR|nr:hypothetical protein [Portunus trituberculatus]